MPFLLEGLETSAKEQGREHEAYNFRCKAKSSRGNDLEIEES